MLLLLLQTPTYRLVSVPYSAEGRGSLTAGEAHPHHGRRDGVPANHQLLLPRPLTLTLLSLASLQRIIVAASQVYSFSKTKQT